MELKTMQTADKTQEHHAVAAADPRNDNRFPMVEPPYSVPKLLYHTLRDRIIDHPLLFYALWRRRENDLFEKHVVRPDSPIVIDGFPRCGNTFAYYAFLLAQDKPLPVGNHMHCVSQFALAQRWRVPAILVVRAPRDTIISNYIYEKELPLYHLVRRYVHFYEKVIRYANGFIISDFPETISSFGRVIMRLNDRFGTSFVPTQDTAEEQGRVLAEIERKHKLRQELNPSLQEGEHRVSFPSADKASKKPMVEAMLDDRKYRDLLKRAEDAYRALL